MERATQPITEEFLINVEDKDTCIVLDHLESAFKSFFYKDEYE